jgi:hypothetical protein
MKHIIKNINEVSEVDRKEHADFLTLLKTERWSIFTYLTFSLFIFIPLFLYIITFQSKIYLLFSKCHLSSEL